ncbi:amino acid adenylation domain-containing protein [Fulvivirga sp. 29W222]|uniref:Amino acid adenylation domain-containing protein n=1 Tax=Fulvivirga marina TaxID=2494733 RepID=A0A937KGX1_9BACT|nr:non-ribosomal peptide synthetase/type I polyketide synthase [Fulvivirga marina]MBL6449613.1 amino acid adenylation domain-containing protein [Fulvivirga marina]
MSEKYTGLEIAIIGISGRFPGAENITTFWENLKSGVSGIKELDDKDLLQEGVSREEMARPDYVKANAYLENKASFDAAFFGYLPDEAELMDPQIRAFHECSWEAIEDSGYGDIGRMNKKVGVFSTGSVNTPWILNAEVKNREGLIDGFTSSHLRDITFLSSRIAYNLNLKGPAVFIQTACSSSLVAVHEACSSLLLGECDMAMAGGVNIKHYSHKGYRYQKGMIHSADGKCRPFDKDANGTVGGEGVGVVVLKKLKQAIEDNDNIYAIIKGSAINNDGDNKVGFTAPSVKGQADAILRAQRLARVDSQSISYIETHGTATELGDPVEVQALSYAFGARKNNPLVLGALKSNIGHLDSAAGVAGLIKAVLCIKNRQLPPTLHFKEPNPLIDMESAGFHVNNTLQDWKPSAGVLRAGVSSFGIGGTNAHIVLEEAPAVGASPAGRRPYYLLPVSAETDNSLKSNCDRLADKLKNTSGINLADVSYTLLTGRKAMKLRKTFVVEGVDEAVKQLRDAEDQKTYNIAGDTLRHTVFMFSGQGAQYFSMCKGLYVSEPVFRHTLNSCLKVAESIAGLNFENILFSDDPEEKIHQTQYTQPILFSVEYALAKLIMSWGIKPDYMIGHSIGEYVAACISGVFKLEDAIRLVVKRGYLMSQCADGGMLSVEGIHEELLKQEIHAFSGVEIAVINTTNSFVLAGNAKEIDAINQHFIALGFETKRVKTSKAFHSSLMDEVLDVFESEFNNVNFGLPSIPFVSNVTGELITPEMSNDPKYWSSHLRSTVQFEKGMRTLRQMRESIFIEVGPGRTLANYAEAIFEEAEQHKAISLVKHRKQEVNDQRYLLERVGKFWEYGVSVDWQMFFSEEGKRRRLALPTYAFEKNIFTTNFNLELLLSNSFAGLVAEETNDTTEYLYHTNWKQARNMEFSQVGVSQQKSNYLVFCGEETYSELIINNLREQGHQVVTVSYGDSFIKQGAESYTINYSDTDMLSTLWKSVQETYGTPHHILYHASLKGKAPIVEYEGIHRELSTGYVGLAMIVKSLAHSTIREEVKLTVFTNHIARIVPGETIDPLKAMLLSVAKIAPSELPNLLVEVVDLPYPFSSKEEALLYCDPSIKQLQAEDFGSSPLTAYRWMQQWKPFLESIPASEVSAGETPIRKGGAYLVIGGFGGMGLSVSRSLAMNHQANLILTHRSPFPEREQWDQVLASSDDDDLKTKIKELQEMESFGATVTLYQLDVSDEEAVKQFCRWLMEDYSDLDGLIWAAGEVDHGGIIRNRDMEDMILPLQSKVHGLLLFEQYLDISKINLVVLFSSIGNVLYHIKFGQVAYNASNEFVEHYAPYLREKYGVKALAINWCDWFDVGMSYKVNSKTLDTTDSEDINAQIVHGISPQEGVAVFYHCIAQPYTAFTIYKGDIGKALENSREQYLKTRETASGEEVKTLSKEHNPVEALTEVYEAFFGKQVSVKDDFFELGGDSLKAMSLVARINKHLGVSLSISDIYRNPTIKELAESLKTLSVNDNRTGLIEKSEEKLLYHTSSEQLRLYFLQSFNPQSIAYNETFILRATESIDIDKFQSALNELVRHQESLRTQFSNVEGTIYQEIIDSYAVPVETLEFQGDLEATVEKFVKPFDLSKAPLLRAGVINTDDAQYILLDTHHIVVDGVSKEILFNELSVLYKGSEVAGLSLTYKDYAEWQCSEQYKDRLEKQKAFWLDKFSEEIASMELPTDFDRTSAIGDEGALFTFEIPKSEPFYKTIAGSGSCFNLLMACYTLLLGRLSNQKDIVVGTPITGRPDTELEKVIGMFVRTLAIRNQIDAGGSFNEYFRKVTENTLACIENQDYPLEDLIDALQLERDPGRNNPLFDCILVYRDGREGQVETTSEEVFINEQSAHIVSRFNLTLSILESEDSLSCNFIYAPALFKESSISNFATYFKNIFQAVTQNNEITISDIPILSEAERNKLLYTWNNSRIDLPLDKTLPILFKEQAIRVPDKAAVVTRNAELSYSELDVLSNQLASFLKSEYNIGEQDMLGVMVERDEWLIVTLLAILKLGATYIPIDPDFPEERILYIKQDSACSLLIDYNVLETFRAKAPEISKDFNAPVFSSSTLAYIIYTSGSTGQPKGVMIEHRSIINTVCSQIADGVIKETDQSLQFANQSFDVSMWDIFNTLLCGATLHMVSDAEKKDVASFTNFLKEHKVTIASLPPAYVKMLDLSEIQSLKTLITGGEEAPYEEAVEFSKRGRYYNSYGPTEASVCASMYTGDIPRIVPIGKPVGNMKLYVLSDDFQLQPPGVVGELCISGPGLSRGYLNKKEITASSFVPNPFEPGERMYRTGDLAIRLSDGNIIFKGRKDTQVKVRGYRIELEEIENILQQQEGVQQVVVEVVNKNLAAFYTSDSEQDMASALHNTAQEKLPAYMVPDNYIRLEHIPITVNGKIDRAELKTHKIEQQVPFEEAVTPEEQLLVSVWKEVLQKQKIGIRDNFFMIGGDSIKSIQISSKLRQQGYEVGIKDIFTYQTIAELARHIARSEAQEEQDDVVGEIPLSPIQAWFFSSAYANKEHFNQSVMLEFPEGTKAEMLDELFRVLVKRHDILKVQFNTEGQPPKQYIASDANTPKIQEYDLRAEDEPQKKIQEIIQQTQSSLQFGEGLLFRTVLFRLTTGSHLFFTLHHLLVDGVSWRILFNDLETLIHQYEAGEELNLPSKTASFQAWVHRLQEYMGKSMYRDGISYWKKFLEDHEGANQNFGFASGKNLFGSRMTTTRKMDVRATEILLTEANKPFNTRINDLLLTALKLAFQEVFNTDSLTVDLENHGRSPVIDCNVQDTIGWFTTFYPVILEGKEENLAESIQRTKESLRAVPNEGIDYLLGRYIEGSLKQASVSSVSFNYLGQFDTVNQTNHFRILPQTDSFDTDAHSRRFYDLDISAIVVDGCLEFTLISDSTSLGEDTAIHFLRSFSNWLESISAYCTERKDRTLSPSDLVYNKLDQETLRKLEADFEPEDVYPLTPLQKGIHFHWVMEPDVNSYFQQTTCRIHGALDMAILEESFELIMKRHPVLRSIFLEDMVSDPVQVVLAKGELPVTYYDLRDICATGDKTVLLEEYRKKDANNKFRLDQGALFRISVFHTGESEYQILWSHHHIIMDGWCMGLIVNEFLDIYKASIHKYELNLPAAPAYDSYLQWLGDRDTAKSLNFWSEYLSGLESNTEIPGKIEDSDNEQVGHHPKQNIHFTLDEEKTAQLRQVCGQTGVTESNFIQTLWGISLGLLQNTNDLAFGAVVSGRPSEVPGVEQMVGLFINTIPVRVSYDESDTFSDVIRRNQQFFIQSTDHHYVQLAEIQTRVGNGFQLDHLVVFENYPFQTSVHSDDQTGFELKDPAVYEETNYDFALTVLPADALEFKFTYDTSKFTNESLETLRDHFLRVLMLSIDRPSQKISEVNLLDEIELQHVLELSRGFEVEYDLDKSVIARFEEHAAHTPNAVALRFEGEELTYRALNEQANLLANVLLAAGGKGAKVPVCVDRSFDLIVSILAILKSGAVYVPLDETFPDSRINVILQEIDASVALVSKTNNERFAKFGNLTVIDPDRNNLDSESDKNPGFDVDADSVAYIIYTSGSTGKPKGVMNTHRGIMNRLLWMQDDLNIQKGSVFIQKTPVVFDVSVWELLLPLITGSTMTIARPQGHKDQEYLYELIKKNHVSVIHFVPSMLSVFLSGIKEEQAKHFTTLQDVICSGEALKSSTVNQFKALFPHINLRNYYGPTEAAIDVTALNLRDYEGKVVSIGKPVANTDIYIVDVYGRLLPQGSIGELCIGGVQVAEGYLNRPQLNTEKFVENRFGRPGKLYRTGDLARWMPSGNLEYLGRIDDQVKLRGYRIELGEISNVLDNYESIRESVVLLRQRGKEQYLVAYYVSDQAHETTLLKSHLKGFLPDYMIPEFYVHMEALPLTRNGKLNKRELPEFTILTKDYVAPEDEIEEKLVVLWSSLLELPKENISVTMDFFELGGHSIKLMTLRSSLKREFGVEIPLKYLFKGLTVRNLRSYLSAFQKVADSETKEVISI